MATERHVRGTHPDTTVVPYRREGLGYLVKGPVSRQVPTGSGGSGSRPQGMSRRRTYDSSVTGAGPSDPSLSPASYLLYPSPRPPLGLGFLDPPDCRGGVGGGLGSRGFRPSRGESPLPPKEVMAPETRGSAYLLPSGCHDLRGVVPDGSVVGPYQGTPTPRPSPDPGCHELLPREVLPPVEVGQQDAFLPPYPLPPRAGRGTRGRRSGAAWRVAWSTSFGITCSRLRSRTRDRRLRYRIPLRTPATGGRRTPVAGGGFRGRVG